MKGKRVRVWWVGQKKKKTGMVNGALGQRFIPQSVNKGNRSSYVRGWEDALVITLLASSRTSSPLLVSLSEIGALRFFAAKRKKKRSYLL